MLPIHVDPFIFGVVSLLAFVFSAVGLLQFWLSLRVVFQGYKTRLLKVGHLTIATEGGSSYEAIYQILDGPRAGQYGRPNIYRFSSKRSMIPNDPARFNTSRLKESDRSERMGWVHRTSEFAVTRLDLIRNNFYALIFFGVGVGLAVLAFRMYLGT